MVAFRIRRLRASDLRDVLSIERQAFPEDPWTVATAGGWLARSRLGRDAQHARQVARLTRFSRLNEAVHLARLIATAAERGCGAAFLYVRADNPGARKLYERAGFTETGALPGYYQPSATDAVVMRLQIGQPAG